MTARGIAGVIIAVGAILTAGCRVTESKPVDIYPEDICAFCKMAFSDQRFAAEIIKEDGEVLKFDDIECMNEFTLHSPSVKIAALYYKDFDSKEWIPSTGTYVVKTDLSSPMGSGKVAFRDSLRAEEFLRARHPAEESHQNVRPENAQRHDNTHR